MKRLIAFLFCVWMVIPAQATIVSTIQVYILRLDQQSF